MTDSVTFHVSTFYHFQPIQDPDAVKLALEESAALKNIQGLIIIGPEGFNATVAAKSREDLSSFQAFICNYFTVHDLFFKDTTCNKPPFRRFKVKIREEIVTLGTPELVPDSDVNHHLSPAEWNRVLKEESDFLLIDTRNWYETKIGTFKGAINPRIDKFTEFPEFIQNKKVDKHQKMLIFCTGGIRCEKGILELQRQGFDQVYQLNGGIINYLREFPDDQFDGECFVFDRRVALRQDLSPSETYDLCPHCGQPANTAVDCKRCDTTALVCDDCLELDHKKDTCSKDCAYHHALHPDRKARPQPRPAEAFAAGSY